MARIIKPPAPLRFDPAKPSVFLAGSIEIGLAEDWQSEVERSLAGRDVIILNPRREEWDDRWEQSIRNPQFREQVEWELAAQEMASHIAMYFAPNTKAPITLLELGLFARTGPVIVGCPDGYWRRGNVEVVCQRYGVMLVFTLEELIARLHERIGASCDLGSLSAPSSNG